MAATCPARCFLTPLGPWTGRCNDGDGLGVEGLLLDIRRQLLAPAPTRRARTVRLSILTDVAAAECAGHETRVRIPADQLETVGTCAWPCALLSPFPLPPLLPPPAPMCTLAP